MKHHGTGRIYYIYIIGSGLAVGGRRFAVGAQQHTGIMKTGKLLMVNGHQPKTAQTLNLTSVVNDVTETVECASSAQLLFCLSDGTSNSEAEA